MYLENDDDDLVISVGEIIQYEASNGDIVEAEVIDVASALGIIRVLPINQLLKIPLWISVDDVISKDDIEFILE